jgi:hypothetical protein
LNPRHARPALPDVTLVAVTSVALRPTVEALAASIKQANFGKVLLLSDQPPPAGADDAITWRQIDRLASRVDYSRFMLRELAGHIETSHALCVQWDGFVLNGGAWDPHFLDFDYIGAVWPHFKDKHNVGNGGFSLRSRRLLDVCGGLQFDGSVAEDLLISRIFRERLEQEGMRFAPEEIAHRFAFERTAPKGGEFGFHGAFNLVRVLSRERVQALVDELEPDVLSPGEHRELLQWALAGGRIGLALSLVLRLVRSKRRRLKG